MDYLSIDLGGTFSKYALINPSGQIKKEWKEASPKSLVELKNALKNNIQTYQDKIKGIGISCPGRIDSYEGYIHTAGALDYLYDVSFKELMSELTELPFSIVNDGKAAALAELWIGNLKDIQNGAAIVLGTGIGGGIILNNELLQGEHFQAGELSFILRQPEKIGETRIIGQPGSAVLFIYKASLELGLETPDHEAVFAALTENHPQVTKLFQDFCRDIAWLLVNLQVILDLQRVVIGGGISAQPLIVSEITRQYDLLREDEPFLASTFAPLEIMACAYKNQSNLLGALYNLFLQLENELTP